MSLYLKSKHDDYRLKVISGVPGIIIFQLTRGIYFHFTALYQNYSQTLVWGICVNIIFLAFYW